KQFPAVDLAAAYALDHVSNKETFDIYTCRRNILIDGLQRIGFDIQKPKATFYVWLKNPKGLSSMDFSKILLEQASVLAIPGVGYGSQGEGYVRMSLTVSGDKNGERLEEAVNRIEALKLM
ncbi:MAG: aminotransferase class I/II-fold pyridoxal phosphate-dependent enzyme, partial [bacterium]